MAAPNLRPLDANFVNSLRNVLANDDGEIKEDTFDYWFNYFKEAPEDEQPAATAVIIANRFANGSFDDQHRAINDPAIRSLFDGYDRTRAAPVRPRTPAPVGDSPSPPPSTNPIPSQGQHGVGQGLPAVPGGGLPTPISESIGTPRGVPHAHGAAIGTTVRDFGTVTPADVAGHARRQGSLGFRSIVRSNQLEDIPEDPDSPGNLGSASAGQQDPGATGTTDSPTEGTPLAPTEEAPSVPTEEIPQVAPVFGMGETAEQVPVRRVGSAGPPTAPDQGDMSSSHSWRGQSQPPVGVRAQQALNWARDEDVDRRRDFHREAREASAWVEDQLKDGRWGDNTRRILMDASDALRTHETFEGYHYKSFMNLEVFDPETMPKYKERLPYREDVPISLGNYGPGGRKSKILPVPGRDHPRPWSDVNDMWKSDREAALAFSPTLDAARSACLTALAHDEDTLWARRPSDNLPAADNLAFFENYYYASCINNEWGGQQGWVHWETSADGTSEVRRLYTGEVMQNGNTSFALERGARRAGIQTALRVFPNVENQRVLEATQGMLILPPVESAESDLIQDLEDIKREAGMGNSRPIDIPALPAGQMAATQDKMDPQGYTANMAQFWKIVRENMQRARADLMAGSGGRGPRAPLDRPASRHFALPPQSLFGAYVWRGVNSKNQVQQDMWRQMRGLKRLFDRESNIAPRQLITEMEQWYLNGIVENGQAPNLMRERDREPETGHPRGLETIEMEWIRFLLNQSMNADMVNDLEPRTTLFTLFAERLSRIFNDPADTLFPTRDTFVSIEELIAHMAKMTGPVKKVVFYPYDVKMWLERLAIQGRCRYTEDWRTYGRVQRPILTHFPENLIIWQPPTNADVNFDHHPEDMIFAPRFDDQREWDDIVHQDPQVLDANIANYFHCLAYRWGHSMRLLKRKATRGNPTTNPPRPRGSWLAEQPLEFVQMQHTLNSLEANFRDRMGWDDNDPDDADGVRATLASRRPLDTIYSTPLAEVVQRTLNRPWPPPDDEQITAQDALQTIRDGIIDECVRADTMLFPGRSTDYRDPDAIRTRESLWDWAKPGVRGESKRFFNLDRWPLQLQSDDTQRRIMSDVDIDQQQIWDAYLEDPTPWTYYRPKARPYADERVKFRSGHRIFPIGDTARQKEVVKNQVLAMVGQSMGLAPEKAARERPTMFQRISSILGLKRARPDCDCDDDHDDVLPAHKLPRVDPEDIPQSYNPAAKQAHTDRSRPNIIPAGEELAGAEDSDGLSDTPLRVETNTSFGERRGKTRERQL